MKKMNFFAAFAIMMAMGNMNASANQNGAMHNEFHMNNGGRVEVRYDGHHDDMYALHGQHLSKHERRMIEERRRMAERRRMEEARRREEMRRMEAHRRHMAHHREVVVVENNNVAASVASVAAGVAVAALIGALAH